jgi:hypothetical protein
MPFDIVLYVGEVFVDFGTITPIIEYTMSFEHHQRITVKNAKIGE